MVLHYFQKKENIVNNIATEQYKNILLETKNFLNKHEFFKSKDYNTSFEIISLFLIMHIRKNLINENRKKYIKINEKLVSLFISDLDESLRAKGIGDMSIGKYVKSYVKKFYFRVKKFPENNSLYKNEVFIDYLKTINLIKNNDYNDVSRIFDEKFRNLINS